MAQEILGHAGVNENYAVLEKLDFVLRKLGLIEMELATFRVNFEVMEAMLVAMFANTVSAFSVAAEIAHLDKVTRGLILGKNMESSQELYNQKKLQAVEAFNKEKGCENVVTKN